MELVSVTESNRQTVGLQMNFISRSPELH